MLAFSRDPKLEVMLKQTGTNIIKIAALYLTSQTVMSKLRETTKHTADLGAQQIRYLRNKYSK
ncbi:hypothetical protein E8P77_16245 [Soehngenia saccharolytica]|nr:hypothetical protein E8P77_16245 [Soehngenia saccharolytica]